MKKVFTGGAFSMCFLFASLAFATDQIRCEAQGYFLDSTLTDLTLRRAPLPELSASASFGSDGWAHLSKSALGISYAAEQRADRGAPGSLRVLFSNGLQLNSSGTFVRDQSGAYIPDPSLTISIGPIEMGDPALAKSSPSLGTIPNVGDLRALILSCFEERAN